jgi:hypothetical protein
MLVHAQESQVVMVQAGNPRGKEVRPEDKMVADSQMATLLLCQSQGMGS